MKKIGKFITAAVLSVCLFCMSAIPAFAYTEGYFRYEITDGVLTITEYFGREEDVTVPNMIAGYENKYLETASISTPFLLSLLFS